MTQRRRGSVRPPGRPRPLPIALQHHALQRNYPEGVGRLRPSRLLWTGPLTPCEESATYEVLIDHQLCGDPRVHVVSPRLDGPDPLPHTYHQTRLCLYVPGTWADHVTIAHTILPWTMEWLLFYELWSAGGGWRVAAFTQSCQHVVSAPGKAETFAGSATTGAQPPNASGFSRHTGWFTEGTHPPRR